MDKMLGVMNEDSKKDLQKQAIEKAMAGEKREVEERARKRLASLNRRGR